MYPKVMKKGPHESVVVANEEQERALPRGWGGLSGQPVKEHVAPGNESLDAPKTKEELQAECDAKGVHYVGTWGVERLKDALANA